MVATAATAEAVEAVEAAVRYHENNEKRLCSSLLSLDTIGNTKGNVLT
jgi:hypothetical protein